VFSVKAGVTYSYHCASEGKPCATKIPLLTYVFQVFHMCAGCDPWPFSAMVFVAPHTRARVGDPSVQNGLVSMQQRFKN
jgi:hypothetical protein